MEEDSYTTIAGPGEAVFRDRGSRFVAYAFPVDGDEQVRDHVAALRKRHYDATHHCYAWRMGPQGGQSRANDDGEPAGSAGRPILGQLMSAGVTDALIVVVRWFGGTKLGVPGLINAYREAAREALERCEKVVRTVDARFLVRFSYEAMNGVMRVVKEMEPRVVSQKFDSLCEMELSIRMGLAAGLAARLEKCEGAEFEEMER